MNSDNKQAAISVLSFNIKITYFVLYKRNALFLIVFTMKSIHETIVEITEQ